MSTIIEFVHRSTSGIMLLLTAMLVWAAFRVFPAGHAARRAAAWSMVFVLIEAAIGAGIVLLGLVDNNASSLRAGYVALHLVNTLVLLGMYAWAAFAAAPRAVAWPSAVAERREPWVRAGLAVMLLASASGAVVALGDTLFPQNALGPAVAADFDATSHILVRLRTLHPLLAVGIGLYFMTVIAQSEALDEPSIQKPAQLALWLILADVALGIVNILALAPMSLQMAHLLVTNLLWIALVWMWLLIREAGADAPASPSATRS